MCKISTFFWFDNFNFKKLPRLFLQQKSVNIFYRKNKTLKNLFLKRYTGISHSISNKDFESAVVKRTRLDINDVPLNSIIPRGGNPDAKRLYDDLLSNYNKLVRPVSNITEAVTVKLKLKLSQLIAVVRISSLLIVLDWFKKKNLWNVQNCIILKFTFIKLYSKKHKIWKSSQRWSTR